MRNLKIFLVVFALLPFLGGCVSIQTRGLAGLGQPGAKISVVNSTPLQVELVGIDTELGELSPGSSVHDSEPVPFRGAPLPLLARVYDNNGNFLGIASKILRVYPDRAVNWTIRLREIEWADAEYRSTYGRSRDVRPSVAEISDRAVDFPRIWSKSTTAVQVANATLFKGDVLVNGEHVASLDPGEAYTPRLRKWVDNGTRKRVSIQVRFEKDGRLVGFSRERTVSVRRSHRPKAYQIILGPRDIR